MEMPSGAMNSRFLLICKLWCYCIVFAGRLAVEKRSYLLWADKSKTPVPYSKNERLDILFFWEMKTT